MDSNQYFKEFYKFHKNVIIFGCGENGKTIYKYLKKTNGGNVVCFADNKKSKNHYKCEKILRLESAKRQFNDSLWIISSPKYSKEMLKQLIDLKIKEDNIIQPTEEDIIYMNKYIHKWWCDEDNYFMYCHGFPINTGYLFSKIRAYFYGRYFELIMSKKNRYFNQEKRYLYNVSICAIFLNEAPYIREWIEFHLIVGVEHFYLYNNMSTDGYMKILEPYIKKGIITLTDWNVPHGQVAAYKDCIKRFSDETKWVGFIDLDEFVVPRKNTIYNFLKQYDYKCGSILIYTKIFGSSGKQNRELNGLVTDDFKKCWKKISDIGKCFYNTQFILSDDKKNGAAFYHICWTKRENKDIPPLNIFGKVSPAWGIQRAKEIDIPIQINHYLTKSYQEFQKKLLQPDATFEYNPRREYQFYLYDNRAYATDDTIEEYLPLLHKRLNGLK